MVSYYESTIEPIEYMAANFSDDEYRGFLAGNILKYISRAGKKGPALEDYRKAEQYLRWLIELETPGESDIANSRIRITPEKTGDQSQETSYEKWIRHRDTQGWT